ncbi:DNA polymerase I [uncultured Mediterranean phage uvMED]|nr:DNA polymerase I [uncultured Mediterranean phage uvMED]
MIVVNRKENFNEAIDFVESNSVLAFDTETTGLNVRHNSVIGFGLSNDSHGVYFVHKYWEDGELKEALSKEDCTEVLKLLKKKKLLTWNGSFDFRIVLHYFDVDLVSSLYIEGILAKHTVDEEQPFKLKEVGVKVYGEKEREEQLDLYDSIKENGGSKDEYYRANLEALSKYCIQDCKLTFKLSYHYLNKIKENGLEKFFFEDEVMPLYKEVTIPMEQKGIPINTKKLKKLNWDISEDIEKIKGKILIEIKPHLEKVFIPSLLNKKIPVNNGIRFRSALADYASLNLPRTKSGKYSFTSESIASLKSSKYKSFLLGELEALDDNTLKEIQLVGYGNPEFNIDSQNDLKILFFKTLGEKPVSKTKKGSSQVNEDFLNTLKDKYPWVADLLIYRKLKKMHSTYFKRYLEKQEDGVFYPDWRQWGTVTGRYGSDIQQLPRPISKGGEDLDVVVKYNNEIRKLFISGKDYLFVDCDYESLEPRVFSHVSGDESLKDIFLDGRDFYSVVAIRTEKIEGASSYKKDENYLGKIDKERRQKAKTYSLGIPYGMKKFSLSKKMGVKEYEAKEIIYNYKKEYPQLKQWMKDTDKKVKNDGVIKTQLGRLRNLKKAQVIYKASGSDWILNGLELWKEYGSDIKLYNRKKEDARVLDTALKQAKNFQIQGLAASITNRACIKIARELKKENVNGYVCAQIHDQVIVRVPEAVGDVWKNKVQKIMEETTKISIPLPAPAEIAKDFYEGH